MVIFHFYFAHFIIDFFHFCPSNGKMGAKANCQILEWKNKIVKNQCGNNKIFPLSKTNMMALANAKASAVG
jgi:hypothetical protein